jgi:internalin A
LKALTLLDLSNNQLTAVPKELGELKALTHLYLSNNQLTAVPKELGALKALTRLSLHNNQLTAVPKELGELKALTHLFLHDNPALGLPREVLGPTIGECKAYGGSQDPANPAEILAYYFRVRGEAGRALGEFKLIVVGRGGAGKTSLVKRLQGRPYNPDEPETHGITIQSLQFDSAHAHAKVTGRVWDFGGQVVLHSMHEFFLTARSLYVLVLGERDDMLERDAAYWLQLIRSYAGAAPVVVALNKSAGRQRQFDRTSFEKTYPPILGWVATECSEADPDRGGITKLRRALTAAIDSPHMDGIRTKFPRKWFAIKDELESMRESYLEYADYARRCAAHEEHDPKEQAALATHLHDLGVALNYGSDRRLRDTTVLRPDWLANGIYAVLRANDRDAKLPTDLDRPLAPSGVVTPDLMGRIHAKAEAWKMLRAADYPEDKRLFLLRLMNLFHLSYPLDGPGGDGKEPDPKNRQHLVPSLLPLQPPDDAEEPAPAPGQVRLRYEFQVVPAPLLPWFVARTYSLIPHRLHWRRGAVLVFGEARARVWTTQDERYVFVTAAGPDDDSENLLTMIRGTFTDLFRGYRGLQVTEQLEHKGQWVPRTTLEQFGTLPREEFSGPDAEPADRFDRTAMEGEDE